VTIRFRLPPRGLALLPLLLALAPAAPRSDYGRIELLRDTWGIPHIFSETDPGAMYGLGHATASERGFQMTYGLRIIQGRLAETIGVRPRGARTETTVDHDRKMRTFGWAPAAARTAANLDAPTRALLEAYCEGVNDGFAAQKQAGTLHPLFRELGLTPEPWTPADCLLSWWHLAQFFSTDGTRELLAWRNRTNPRPGQPAPPRTSTGWHDDATAVVQPGDVDAGWLKQVEDFRRRHGLGADTPGAEGPKFSHAWVVGGGRTTTGSAVLVSDPQTPVRNPSLWMEFHVSGKTIDARGIGVPGSPALLIGFNRRVAWGLTALGADQADLFRLETSPDRPGHYRWNGGWRPWRTRTERIAVRGDEPVDLVVRETHLGPLVGEFSFRQPGDPEVALKRIPICEPDRDTIQAAFAMMRATQVDEFAQALAGWRFPSANCVYGDASGRIGYATIGAIPIRARSAADQNGNEASPGTGDADDWRGFVPSDLLPRLRDPAAGLILSANHRPVASFYRIPLGISTGSLGDTMRSWRLRERLAEKAAFTPTDVLDVHFDTVNPARREIVRLGLHLRATRRAHLSPPALAALDVLEKWFHAGASSDLRAEGAALATRLSTFFRFTATPLALQYGGGESGLARFLKDAAARIKADPAAAFGDEETRYIDTLLAEAWAAQQQTGRGTPRATLGWFDSLDGFGSLQPAHDLPQPGGITCLDGQTIHSQAGQSYTQFVPLHDVDSAQSICPIGHSDRPDSPHRLSTMEGWGTARLHPAPLSRAAVEKITAARTRLSP
jgi:penicillin amidase